MKQIAFLLMMGVMLTSCAQKQDVVQKKARVPSNVSRLIEEFTAAVGFVDGVYEAEGEASSACPFGRAYFREHNGAIVFMIDEQLIFSKAKLGENSVVDREKNCLIKTVIKQNGSRVVSRKVEQCGPITYVFNNDVTFSNDSLNYSAETTKNGVATLKLSCRLERKP